MHVKQCVNMFLPTSKMLAGKTSIFDTFRSGLSKVAFDIGGVYTIVGVTVSMFMSSAMIIPLDC